MKLLRKDTALTETKFCYFEGNEDDYGGGERPDEDPKVIAKLVIGIVRQQIDAQFTDDESSFRENLKQGISELEAYIDQLDLKAPVEPGVLSPEMLIQFLIENKFNIDRVLKKFIEAYHAAEIAKKVSGVYFPGETYDEEISGFTDFLLLSLASDSVFGEREA